MDILCYLYCLLKELLKVVHNFDVFFPICGFPCMNIGLLYVLGFWSTASDEPQETVSSKGWIINNKKNTFKLQWVKCEILFSTKKTLNT